MRTTALLLPLAFLACSSTPPPVSDVPPPSPPPASLGELQQAFLPRIEDNRRAVDSYEARKEEIVSRKVAEVGRLGELRELRFAEVESQRQEIALLEAQLADRRAQLAATDDETLRRDLRSKIAALERDIGRDNEELERRRQELESTEAELRRFEGADGEALFLDEMQPLYNEGIELHLGFYRGVIEVARQQLAPGEEASALIEHFTARAAERDRLLGSEVEPAAFATLRHEFELDQRMSQAWLSALILEVRFSLNEFRLESISDEEREELELLAESLQETWTANPHLVMYIDGHADSKQFRGSSPCVSASKNRELSRRRGEAVRDFFAERLGGESERINLDWFGNFNRLTGSHSEELENRRIELRVTSRRRDGSFDSHRDFFTLLGNLQVGGRRFVRAVGAWIEAGCVDREVDAEVEYLSSGYRDLVERLGLAETKILLEVDGRELEIALGNAFTVEDGGRCIAVRPCPDSGS